MSAMDCHEGSQRRTAGGIFDPCRDDQMPFGERAALEGVLDKLAPSLVIEIGAGADGPLDRLATHAQELHCFEPAMPQTSIAQQSNVTLDIGNAGELLPAQLARLAEEQRNVDLVWIGGDHASSQSVRQYLEILLNSSAVGKTTIMVHNACNERMRAGLNAVHYEAWPKVAHVDLDFIAGYVFEEGALRNQLGGGIALALIDAERLAYGGRSMLRGARYPTASLLARARDLLVADESAAVTAESDTPPESALTSGGGEEVNPLEGKLIDRITELEGEILRLSSVAAHHEGLWQDMMDSASWTVTKPLRYMAAWGRRR
jgi:hypothetical protein